MPPAGAYGAAEAAAAMERRRRELEHLAGIADVLTDVERRADELNRSAAELALKDLAEFFVPVTAPLAGSAG
jgi:hypothetical protein